MSRTCGRRSRTRINMIHRHRSGQGYRFVARVTKSFDAVIVYESTRAEVT